MAISQHAEEMLDFGEKLLRDSFNVEGAQYPDEMRAPYMRIVRKYSPKSQNDHFLWIFLSSPHPFILGSVNLQLFYLAKDIA